MQHQRHQQGEDDGIQTAHNIVDSILHQILYVDSPPNNLLELNSTNDNNASQHLRSDGSLDLNKPTPILPPISRVSPVTRTSTLTSTYPANRIGPSYSSDTYGVPDLPSLAVASNIVSTARPPLARNLHINLTNASSSVSVSNLDGSSVGAGSTIATQCTPTVEDANKASSTVKPEDALAARALGHIQLVNLCEHATKTKGGNCSVVNQTTVNKQDADEISEFSFDLNLEDEDEMGTTTITKANKRKEEEKATNSNTRIQMFGSEYARYLSTSTPFRPPPKPKPRLLIPRRTPKISSHFSNTNKPPMIARTRKQSESSASDCTDTLDPKNGPIVELLVTSLSEGIPPGYTTVRSSASSTQVLCIKRERNWSRAWFRPLVTALAVILPDRREFVPPGYCVIRKNSEPANFGTSERVYICYRRSREGNPITDLQFLDPRIGDAIPQDYTVLERTPFSYSACVEKGFLAYRQRLANLETLRPLPLFKSEHPAYFATGGGIVQSSVGKRHVMELRRKVSVLSPASVASRLLESGKLYLQRDEGSWSFDEGSAARGGVDGDSHTRNRSSSYFSEVSSQASSITGTIKTISLYLDYIPHLSTYANSFASNTESQLVPPHKLSLLTPILTALYNQHGGSSHLALEGVTNLLKTSFFDDDIPASVQEMDDRCTMLDVCTQVVCDVAMSARESHFCGCTLFLNLALKKSQSRLNNRTLGYLARFAIFYANFESSSNSNLDHPRAFFQNWFGFLQQNISESKLHVGANPAEQNQYCELLLQQIRRSGGSEVYWHDLTLCSTPIVPKDHRPILLVIGFLLKVACGPLRRYPRDVRIKCLALELLLGQLKFLKSYRVWEVPLRRFIPDVILLNTQWGISDVDVFQSLQSLLIEFLRLDYQLMERAVLLEHCLVNFCNLDTHVNCLEQLLIVVTQVAPQIFRERYLHYYYKPVFHKYHTLLSFLAALANLAQRFGRIALPQTVEAMRNQVQLTADTVEEQTWLSFIGVLGCWSDILRQLCHRVFQVTGVLQELDFDWMSLDSASISATTCTPLMSPIVEGKNDVEANLHDGGLDLHSLSVGQPSEVNLPTDLSTFYLTAESNLAKAITSLKLPQKPHIVATFLRLHMDSLNPVQLGEYLSSEEPFLQQVRDCYVRAIAFSGMNLEQGLRHFLTQAGFRLPGEAQRVDRIICSFSKCYWHDNRGDILKCPFPSEDAVYLIAFAVIMLNTDLHKSSSKIKKMTKAQFIRNLRGTDMQENAVTDDYMSAIYDSIERVPIELEFASNAQEELSHTEWIEESKHTQELLRSVAEQSTQREHHLREVTVANAPLHKEFLSNLMKNIYKPLTQTIHIAIDSPLSDAACLSHCLDLIRYGVCAAVMLGCREVQRSLAQQLGRVMFIVEREQDMAAGDAVDDAKKRQRINLSFYTNDQSYTETEWHRKLEHACESPRYAIDACRELYKVVKILKSGLAADTQRTRLLKRTASRIQGGSYLLLKNKTREFILEGMIKKQGPSGRIVRRRLFLFSDRLLYTSKSNCDATPWKINGDLLLTATKVSDDGEFSKKFVFRIHHPNKSFLIICANLEEKQMWMNSISDAIEKNFEAHCNSPSSEHHLVGPSCNNSVFSANYSKSSGEVST